MKMKKNLIIYVVNHAAFFVSHRLPLAISSKQSGFNVALFSGQAGSVEMERIAEEKLNSLDILHKRTIFSSSGINPLIELFGLVQLIFLIIRFRPDIIHCASPKGVLYGGIAARICRVKSLVLAISGMGYAFTKNNNNSLIRIIIKLIYTYFARFAFNHPNLHVIVQNHDDRSSLINNKWVQAKNISLIPGSGININDFNGCHNSEKENIVLLPARMLKDKGVLEFVEAARILKKFAPDWQFVLAGAAGYDSPSAINDNQLLSWQAEGILQWKGYVEDMVPLFKAASIVCLPSYREGMPKVLLEAAAARCAIVTTDVPGCREAILPGLTGVLVPVADSNALAVSLLSLIKDSARRHAYGEMGRHRAIEKFSIDSVVLRTAEIYKELLSD
jgi:glycosyltransferase involved in cell wall biosynthesis